MDIYALVGSSGTGKSHRAAAVADQLDAEAIIDDGIMVIGNRIVAGSSAKRQSTIIGAIKAALFIEDSKAREIIDAIAKYAPQKILILGTSAKMVKRIANRLELPPPTIKYIEDFASEQEIKKAKYIRARYSRHVIPAPTMEVKKSFPGILVDPIHIFVKKKAAPEKKDWLEQSLIRPTFTLDGKLTITDRAVRAIIGYAAQSVKGVAGCGRILVAVEEEGIISIDISTTMTYGLPLHRVASKLQQQIIAAVERLTGLQVKKVDVLIKNLSFVNTTQVHG